MRDKALDSANQAAPQGRAGLRGWFEPRPRCADVLELLQAVDLFKEAGDTKMSAQAAQHCRTEKMRDVAEALIQLCRGGIDEYFARAAQLRVAKLEISSLLCQGRDCSIQILFERVFRIASGGSLHAVARRRSENSSAGQASGFSWKPSAYCCLEVHCNCR